MLDQINKRSYTVLCEEFGIRRSAISDIKKHESKLRNYKRKMIEMGVKRPEKIMKLRKDEQLDEAVFI